MRSIGLSLPRPLGRQVAVGMVIAGTALLHSMAASLASPAPAGRNPGSPDPDRSDEQFAFAEPRVAPPGGRWGGAGLPQPLSTADAARIRQVFEAQSRGDVGAADQILARTADKRLLGEILADRYLRDAARPTASMLTSWLKTYGDLADAPAIYAALKRIAPRSASLPPAPSTETLGTEQVATPAPEEADPAILSAPEPPGLRRSVLCLAESGRTNAALRLITRSRLPQVTGAALRAAVARALLAQGRDIEALATGRDASLRSSGRVGAGAFVAGLAAWRLGRVAEAATWFERASRAQLIAESARAGAAFWAARAHLALGDAGGYRPWMLRAAAARRTFYGQLAARRLGLGGWTLAIDGVGEETLGEADVEAVAAEPGGNRAFALLQVGQTGRAEATLRRMWPRVSGDFALRRSIMLVAQASGLTDLASQIASILQLEDGRPRDATRFPTPLLRPHGGFTLDPALVYALTRVESNFDAGAVSGVGAHGLMQLMPLTAGEMSGRPDRFAGAPGRLADKPLNLELGQRYVGHLAASSNVAGDLIRLLASYNCGPGRITGWDAASGAGADDPLMWMETIPADETRDFVHRSLAYLWIYASRLGVPAPSLDSLAAGIRPSFAQEVALAGAPITLH